MTKMVYGAGHGYPALRRRPFCGSRIVEAVCKDCGSVLELTEPRGDRWLRRGGVWNHRCARGKR